MIDLHAYLATIEIVAHDLPFYSLIAAAMLQADTNNLEKLQAAWPEVWDEFYARYHAPGGAITQEEQDYLQRLHAAQNVEEGAE